MGKKKQGGSALGRTIIKDRFGQKKKTDGDTFLHTADLNDGYEWGRLNLQSVTEQNNLDDFLATAELAGTEFTAEKMNITFVSKEDTGLPQGEELDAIRGLHKQHEELLRIPRRPHWTKEMSKSEVDQNEKMAFLEWRRSLAALQEVEGLVMTPYEKNLDFWRQLWRVIEKSDIVVQIVDARNPLLFYCPDLESYVSEVDPKKQCVVLLNKADFLNAKQRATWADHFTKLGIRAAFWSAVDETKRQEELAKAEEEVDNEEPEQMNEDESSVDEEVDDAVEDNNATNKDCVMETNISSKTDATSVNISADLARTVTEQMNSKIETDAAASQTVDQGLSKTGCDSKDISCENTDLTSDINKLSNETGDIACDKDDGISQKSADTDNCEDCSAIKTQQIKNTGKIHSGPELLDYFRSLHTWKKGPEDLTTVGMVGYPNVGKSSTINAILNLKKVPVSATPGRTKHFQTLFVDRTLMLCDCPGLVFPSFVTTKADLVASGILPIDQMRDHVPPASLICAQIPRRTLERMYGIIIPKPGEGEDPNRPPTSYEVLNSYGAIRGFMTVRGNPDCPRASRYILKDYVNGKLLFCHPPPDEDAVEFNKFNWDAEVELPESQGTSGKENPDVPVPSKIDKEFFIKEHSRVHARTAKTADSEGNPISSPHSSQASLNEKPWKKHHNSKRKEKLRRVYGYLDNN